MPGCAISTCNNYNQNTKGTKIKYFRFPKNSDLTKQWINACRRKDKLNLKNACICSDHFEASCFQIPMKHKLLNYSPKNSRNLKDDAVPTLNLAKSEQINQTERRSVRAAKRKCEDTKIISGKCTTTDKCVSEESLNEVAVVKIEVDVDNQTDNRTSQNECSIGKLKMKIEELEMENTQLKREVKEIRETTARQYESVFETILTPDQIKKLLDPIRGKKMHNSQSEQLLSFDEVYISNKIEIGKDEQKMDLHKSFIIVKPSLLRD